MSNQVGTSRAGRTKDKHAKSTAASTPASISQKTEKSTGKHQATVEQMRMAQMIDSGKDSANLDRVKQLCEMTGRSEEDVVVALHDAEDDADAAVLMLLDEGQQGEWEVQDKKKKRSNTLKSSEKEASPAISIPDNHRPDRSHDRHDYDRQDAPPRRGRDRRNGGPPPRLANRGRGRERNNYRGDRDRERSGFNDRGGFGDRGGFNDVGRYNDRNSYEQNGEEDWDAEMAGGNEMREQRRGDRDRGGFGDRGRGRGRGGFGRPASRGGRPRRFDRPNDSNDGPHIDTWTNETAENAEKEKSSWGETWTESNEDCFEDQWTGSLDDTKVFTPSQTKAMEEPDLTPAMNDTTSALGQRLDVGSLFSKSAEFPKAPDFTKTGEPTSGDSFFSTYNQQAAESIKNSIGIGSSARQNLSSGSPSQPQSLSQLPPMPQRGEPSPPSHPAVSSVLPSPSAPVPPSMLPQSTSNVPPPMHPPASSAPLPPQPSAQAAQPQRRPQRSKLPPPSKIPSTAVEMPGHRIRQLDVQFGVDFGGDTSQMTFGQTGDTNSSYTSASPPASSAAGNHLVQPSSNQPDAGRQASSGSSPSAGSKPSQNALPPMDASPSRPSVFPNSVYTSPSKSDSAANKVAEPIPFPSPVAEHKSSGLINAQRTSQSPSAHSQGSSSTSKSETSNMPNFSTANGYAPSSFPHSTHSQSHKPVSSGSQAFPPSGPTPPSSVASFPSQFSSQTQYAGAQQMPYPSAGQSQFPGNQSQFPAGGTAGGPAPVPAPNQYLPGQSQFSANNQSSFPAAPVVTQSQYQGGGNQYHGNYQANQASFQSPPGSQSSQNSMYSSTSQSSGGSYPSGQGSFHVRDSQSAGSLQQTGGSHQQQSGSSLPLPQSAVSQSGNTFQPQQPAPGLQKPAATQSTGSFTSQTYSAQHAPATSTQSSGTAFNSQTFSTQHASQHAQATTTQSPNTFNSQTFSAQHSQNLQPSPLGNKLGDSLSKMSLKDSGSLDSRSSQYDSSSSTTTVSMTSTTTTSSSISTSTSTVSATSTPVLTNATLNSRIPTSLPVTTKAPPNLPPGVPLMNPHLFMGQAAASGLPPFYGLQGLQQPLYGFDDIQMMQPARLPLQSNYYDLSAFSGVPSSVAPGRDQAAALGTAPFTGTSNDNKQMNRVDAQSPNQSNQQQSAHNAPQQTLPFNFHYGYYYPGVLPGAASFQYPMFPIPPVTNAAAAAHVPGTTTAAQLPKTYGSHQGFSSKGGYEEVGGGQDLTKVAYAGVQQQAKVAAAAAVASRTGSTADLNTGAFAKSHTQGFDKQGFPGGTPPPFTLPMGTASQAGPLGAPAAPYAPPFLPMVPPQPHNQTLLHPHLQQDSGTGSGRGMQPPANQGKSGAAKPYGSTYWGN